MHRVTKGLDYGETHKPCRVVTFLCMEPLRVCLEKWLAQVGLQAHASRFGIGSQQGLGEVWMGLRWNLSLRGLPVK